MRCNLKNGRLGQQTGSGSRQESQNPPRLQINQFKKISYATNK